MTDVRQKVIELSEGNIGAVSVLLQVSEMPELLDYLLEYGPRGEGIWMLYKDRCDGDISLFVQALVLRMKTDRPEVYEALLDEAVANEAERIWEAS